MLIDTDLFGPRTDTPSLPGLSIWPEVISIEREHELIARIEATELAPFRFQGWLGKRQTRSYGWIYDFDRGHFARGEHMPDWLNALRDEIAPAAGLPADELVQALLIRYDAGAGIGWHKDRPVFEHVVGLSLGNAAALRFRRRTPRGFDRFSLEAQPRSALPPVGRGQERLGTQHRGDDHPPSLHHLPHPRPLAIVSKIEKDMDPAGVAAAASGNPGSVTDTERKLLNHALSHWRSNHGNSCTISAPALREAAAAAPLMETGDGHGFEPSSFRELAEFIDELPF